MTFSPAQCEVLHCVVSQDYSKLFLKLNSENMDDSKAIEDAILELKTQDIINARYELTDKGKKLFKQS